MNLTQPAQQADVDISIQLPSRGAYGLGELGYKRLIAFALARGCLLDVLQKIPSLLGISMLLFRNVFIFLVPAFGGA